jgi:ABC-2 type transport system permease protein
MTLRAGSLPWFARHELRFAWRDFVAMLSGGHRVRLAAFTVGGLAVYALLHLIAGVIIGPAVEAGIVADKPTLAMVGGIGLLFFSVTLSQALEAVTRVYYARADLDLLLSSPASIRTVFAVRTGAVALSTALLSALLASPIVNLLIIFAGSRWLWAYLVLPAFAALAVAIAILLTVELFRLVGPKRTRFIAQILAAIIGAGFVIGIQAVAILSFDSYSRFALFGSSEFVASLPSLESWFWLPAKAVMGDATAAISVALLGFGVLAAATIFSSQSYGRLAVAAAGVTQLHRQRAATKALFRPRTPRQTLRRKEWRLLQRDPWLLSQSLMQMLYLVPPALLLWINYGEGAGSFVVIVPVLVMAAGQLAGGLAWLALSGEDAYDLVTTAPIASREILRAKIEAVLAVVGAVLAPLLLLLAINSFSTALATGACAILAAASATAIQIWFRVPMRRAMFRRRQVASRAATISEALVSIMWAGTGILLVMAPPFALAPALVALLVLAIARTLAPKRS